MAALGYSGGAASLNFIHRETSGAWVSVLAFDAGTAVLADFAFADLDGDGRPDLLWLRAMPDNIRWELAWAPRQGAGFGAVRTLQLPTGLDRAPAFSVGDVNGDGRADVLLLLQSIPPGSGSASSELRVLRNDGAGGRVLAQTLALSAGAATAIVGDVDADGRSDVVVAHSVLQQTGVLLQGADGTLQAERLFDGGYGYFDGVDALALLDLNGDGRRDIVITNTVLLGRATTVPWAAVAVGRVERLLCSEGHQALHVQATQRGHSREAEVRHILESAVSPEGRVKLSSLLADMGRRARLIDEEFAVFEQVRSKTPSR